MRKIIIVVGSCLSVFLASCVASSERSASRDYVKAAQKVSQAAKAYDTANYLKSYELSIEAKSDVENIVEKYPDSAIALKVVTDSSTLIGPCRYLELTDVIIPRLQIFGNPEVSEVELAWVVAVSRPQKDRDNALYALANRLIWRGFPSKLEKEKQDKIISEIMLKIQSPDLRSKLKSAMLYKENKKKANTDSADANVVAIEHNTTSSTIEQIKDFDAFIVQAKTEASLVSYDLKAIEAIIAKSELIFNATPSQKSEFKKILDLAFANVQKITMPNVKEEALSRIAIAYSNFGDSLRTIEISKSIKNQALFSNIVEEISDSVDRGENYTEALEMINRVADINKRDQFLSKLSSGVASLGMYEKARNIAKSISSMKIKNQAYAKSARLAFDNNNAKEALISISFIDIKDLECLSVFDIEQTSRYNSDILTGMRLADLSSKIIPIDSAMGDILNTLAMKECETTTGSPKAFSMLSREISKNLISLGKMHEALDFLSRNVHNTVPAEVLQDVCDIAVLASKTDNEFSKQAFALAASIADTLSYQDMIALALSVQKSGLGREDCAEILMPFLPKFKEK